MKSPVLHTHFWGRAKRQAQGSLPISGSLGSIWWQVPLSPLPDRTTTLDRERVSTCHSLQVGDEGRFQWDWLYLSKDKHQRDSLGIKL